MIEKKETKEGLFYFVVKARNGQVIVKSEYYESEISRDNGIASLTDIMERIINNNN